MSHEHWDCANQAEAVANGRHGLIQLCKPEVTGSIPVRSTSEGPAKAGLLVSYKTTPRYVDPAPDPDGNPSNQTRAAGGITAGPGSDLEIVSRNEPPASCSSSKYR